MSKYLVSLPVSGMYSILVEAEDEDNAKEVAWETAHISLCHACSADLDIQFDEDFDVEVDLIEDSEDVVDEMDDLIKKDMGEE